MSPPSVCFCFSGPLVTAPYTHACICTHTCTQNWGFSINILKCEVVYRANKLYSLQSEAQSRVIYFFGEKAERTQKPRPQKSRLCPSLELEAHVPQRTQSELSWAQKTVSFLLGRQSMEGSARLCVLQGWLAFKNVPDISVLLLSMDKLDLTFHLEKRRKFTKYQVYARCFICFISILPDTLGDRLYFKKLNKTIRDRLRKLRVQKIWVTGHKDRR